MIIWKIIYIEIKARLSEDDFWKGRGLLSPKVANLKNNLHKSYHLRAYYVLDPLENTLFILTLLILLKRYYFFQFAHGEIGLQRLIYLFRSHNSKPRSIQPQNPHSQSFYHIASNMNYLIGLAI